MSSIKEQYESLPYPHYVHPASDPAHLAAIAQILGLDAVDPAACRVLDIGCGAGPGGIVAALASKAVQPELLLADISSRALDFARANAELAGLPDTRFQQADLFAAIEGRFSLIVANPPYLLDAGERLYRHGGGVLGSGLLIGDGELALVPLALLPPMLQVGQPRPRATSRRAWRTVGVHWLMFCQLPAMHSSSLQPSTACAGPPSPRPKLRTKPKGAACRTSLANGRIAVPKCAFIANLSLV